MERIYDAMKNGKSLYDTFKELLDKQLNEDLVSVETKYKDGAREDKIDQVYKEYYMSMDKLSYLPSISNLDESLQNKFTRSYLYIDGFDLDIGRKLDAILSMTVLFSKNPANIKDLDDEKVYLVSTVYSNIPTKETTGAGMDQYDLYSKVMCDKSVLDAVVSKTNVMNERREALREVLTYCDSNVTYKMDENGFKNAVKDSVHIINDYKINTKQEENRHIVA